jgi:hypothetical protein
MAGLIRRGVDVASKLLEKALDEYAAEKADDH